MSTIEEIMIAAMDYADERVMVVHGRGTQGGVHRAVCALREMITAALAEARREGAEAMREAVESLREDADEIFPPTGRGRQASVEARDVVEWYSESIRALPLPTGERQAVRLTDEQIEACRLLTGYAAGSERFRLIAIAIESVVLAANGLEV